VMAYMRTEYPAGPATVANIWAAGYFPGNPITLDLVPPPRPAPNAFLTITKPKDAVGDVVVKYTTDPDFSAYVRLQLSAPFRQPIVSSAGQLMWQKGRSYYGRWSVGWEQSPELQIENTGPSWWP